MKNSQNIQKIAKIYFLIALIFSSIFFVLNYVNAESRPGVMTMSPFNVENTIATLQGLLYNLGGAFEVEVWFEWGQELPSGAFFYLWTTPHQIINTTMEYFYAVISSLANKTYYHFRAVARNNAGTVYGGDISFRTNRIPIVNAGLDRTVDEFGTILLTGSAYDWDNDMLYYSWNCQNGILGTPNNLTTLYQPPQIWGVDSESFLCTFSTGDAFGGFASDDIIITVNNVYDVDYPVVKTEDPSNISYTGQAVLHGAILETGCIFGICPLYSCGNQGCVDFPSSNICIKFRFEWGLTTSYGNVIDGCLVPTLSQQKVVLPVDFQKNIFNLISGKYYHFRACANVHKFWGCGEDKIFYVEGPPTADAGPDRTVDEWDMQTNSQGTVLLDGSGSSDPDQSSSTLIYSWFCPKGTLSDPYAIQPTYTAPYVDADINYNCTLKVIDDSLLSDSDQVIVTVLNKTFLPEVSTNEATDIFNNTAFLRGSLDSLGGFNSANVWFEWGKTDSYGNETTHQIKDALGAFDFGLSGLSPGTIYHFRAVAQNNEGIVYGDDKAFVTSDNNKPTSINHNIRIVQQCFKKNFPVFFSWDYVDIDDNPLGTDLQSAYQIQIDNDSSFNSPEIDSQKVFSSLNSYAIEELNFDRRYYWQLKVWDTKGPFDSGWVSGPDIFTPYYPFPFPDFDWEPKNPLLGDEVLFTDKSICYSSGCEYEWTFQDGEPSFYIESNTLLSSPPPVIFSGRGYKNVTLKVTDYAGNSCQITKTIGLLSPPFWREIIPWRWIQGFDF